MFSCGRLRIAVIVFKRRLVNFKSNILLRLCNFTSYKLYLIRFVRNADDFPKYTCGLCFITKCTIKIRFWKPEISYKICCQNAGNTISGLRILKIFWQSMSPTPPPPYKDRAFGTRHLPLPSNILQSFRHCL